jgi:hypothetical protein
VAGDRLFIGYPHPSPTALGGTERSVKVDLNSESDDIELDGGVSSFFLDRS